MHGQPVIGRRACDTFPLKGEIVINKREVGGKGMRLTADFCEQRLNVLIFEGKPSTKHHIEDHSATPNINLRSGVETTTNNFRGGVVGTSATRFEEVAVLDLTRETEVGNLDIQVVVEQDVFWLEIPMNDLEFVAIFDAGHDLLEEPTGNRLSHASVRDDVLEQFTAGKFEDDDDVGGSGDDFVSGYGIGFSELKGIERRIGRTYSLMM